MSFYSKSNPMFRSIFSETIFENKYAHKDCETWAKLAHTLVTDVCSDYLNSEELVELTGYIRDMKFIPGGRYLYYAGRNRKFFNNCYIFISQEDSRENWAELSWKVESSLMTGGGIGNNYSIYRAEGAAIKGSGGVASGPISKMEMTNEIGRKVMQGGSRRSALYASLIWEHPDINKFLHCKDWASMEVKGTNGLTIADLKEADFNYPAPLDMTNISVNYNTNWLETYIASGAPGFVFIENVRQALKTGEPGFSFNFYAKEKETGRNACTEVTSEDDCDVCNLGSINMGRIESIKEYKKVVHLATKFLMCGLKIAEMPFDKIDIIRKKNSRIGLGLMGVHEWLIKRNYRYEMNHELRSWMEIYEYESDSVADSFSIYMRINRPAGVRAIAPTGTIAILAGTTSGIEPLFALAYIRRYLIGKIWHYQYVIDNVAAELIDIYQVDPDSIESAIDLAVDPERRIRFQADIQDYVDMGISSTINMSSWGTEHNNENTVESFAKILATYAHRLRGFTCYPDGARSGQPLTPILYSEAKKNLGAEFKEHIEIHDLCDITGKGGSCGV